MKLEIKDGKHRGNYITLKIGERVNTSYWGAPPSCIDHVGLEYLSDRYPLITTEKRMTKFKELYRELGIED